MIGFTNQWKRNGTKTLSTRQPIKWCVVCNQFNVNESNVKLVFLSLVAVFFFLSFPAFVRSCLHVFRGEGFPPALLRVELLDHHGVRHVVLHTVNLGGRRCRGRERERETASQWQQIVKRSWSLGGGSSVCANTSVI